MHYLVSNLHYLLCRYEYVGALLRDFPHLTFSINGGITSLHQAQQLLEEGVHGVMIGRAAYNK